MSLLRSASVVSGLTLASRITGLVREQHIAAAFGASAATDAFQVAFRIPNLLRRLFAEGAFSQAFVPILAASRATDCDEKTQALIDAVGTVLLWRRPDRRRRPPPGHRPLVREVQGWERPRAVRMAKHAAPHSVRTPLSRTGGEFASPLDSRIDSPTLTFEPPDEWTFRSLELARRAARVGGTLPCVLNAATEEAANAFLRREVGFLAIADLVEQAMEAHQPTTPTLESLLEADAWARATTLESIRK